MKYIEFKNTLNKPYFHSSNLALLGLSLYGSQLSLWVKKGYLIMPKRGIFVFADKREQISSEEISSILYEPSYISLEWALGHYGLIPEMVFAKTCLTTRTTRKFSNTFGAFSYRHIQPKLFFGYTPVETPSGKYLLAEPEKALLDYLYFNRGKIRTEEDISELRINMDELKKITDRKKFETYLREFNVQKLDRIIHAIISH